ncbi:cytochrome P450 [Multifurca ochricompacta]|uniref:Cytochrome P450 n=1 Tax=Multifurca ochricompacta TaxID=376703 RepID=A0AAD4M9F9_9AGAM|nr:cytochrome P450 [Multifurca ochricompacta]
MLADPKALQYILHMTGYHYPKSTDRAHFNELVVGKGLVAFNTHQRQRKIISPSFNAPQLRSFLPLFHRTASKLVQRWNDDVIPVDPSGQPLINMNVWLSRATLDVIGEAGFDFQFGSLDDIKTPLAAQYDNLFVDSTLYPAWYDLIFKESWHFIPEPLLEYVRYVPTREYRRFRSFLDYIRNMSREMIKESMINGDGKDIMSVLLRANESSDPKSKMADNEVIDQISTLLLAGHDTTANTLTWFFYEVARHPDAQERIRQEIAVVRARTNSEEYTTSDLDSMVYTQAALKESMRLHPIFWMLARVATRDDVIPLAFPITTKSGEQITSIPIKKGTPIDISTAAYNRLPEVWGEDSNEWNPERFLDPNRVRQSNIGLFGNLLLASGSRACIGWRFSVLEMQILITTLLENFEFSLPPQNEKTKIYRKPSHVMMPMADGEKGAWMGLRVKPIN